MADIELSIVLSRELLGLSDLQIAYGPTYYVAPGSLGGGVAWDRTTAGSPFLDGTITTNRKRQMVTENLLVEVKGASLGQVQLAQDELVLAAIQHTYLMTVDADDAHYVYVCEAADYTLDWKAERLAGRQRFASLSIPRQPVLASSGVAG